MSRDSASLRDMLSEALLALRRRKLRTGLSMIGSLLGMSVLAASITLTASARSQVEEQFDALRPTVITVSREGGGDWIRPERVSAVRRLPGVAAAATVSHSSSPWPVSRLPGDWSGSATADVVLADPAVFAAIRARVVAGRLYDSGHLHRGDAVAILGESLAHTLGVDLAAGSSTVFLAGRPYTVIGVVADTPGEDASLLLSVFLPPTAPRSSSGTPTFAAEQLVVNTDRGWTDRVAEQVPVAARPEGVDGLDVELAANPQRLRTAIGQDVQSLLLALGAITLLIGAVSIGNTTLMNVVERRTDIGLRRALGASRTATLVQILTEASLAGLGGGLAGAVLGEVITIVVTAAIGWPARLNPWLLPVGPALGLLTGALAGTYPAVRAAAVEPAEALRGP